MAGGYRLPSPGPSSGALDKWTRKQVDDKYMWCNGATNEHLFEESGVGAGPGKWTRYAYDLIDRGKCWWCMTNPDGTVRDFFFFEETGTRIHPWRYNETSC